MPRRIWFLFVLLLIQVSWPGEVGSTTVLPLDLPRLATQAGRIFLGRCEEVTVSLDENGLPATYARFQVTDGLKGVETGERVLIKQFGVVRKPLAVGEGESAVVPMKTMALTGEAYRPGRNYLLFLYPESDLGFTSPVGGGQGRFEIKATESAFVAVNPLNNRFLKTFREGPVDLEALLEAIRSAVP